MNNSGLTATLVAVLFGVLATEAHIFPLPLAALMYLMPLRETRRGAARTHNHAWTGNRGIGVNVNSAIHPSAIPVLIVDEHAVIAPSKTAGTPAPRRPALRTLHALFMHRF